MWRGRKECLSKLKTQAFLKIWAAYVAALVNLSIPINMHKLRNMPHK